MTTLRVPVKPKLLQWARTRSRIEPSSLVERFPHLDQWEQGTEQPTLKQLERFAKATHTPIGFLFLDAPPVEDVPIPDFRTRRNQFIDSPSPDLLDTVYTCQQRQEWYREFAQWMGESARDFVGSVRVTEDVVKVAARMRTTLQLDIEERRNLRTWSEALRQFIEHADALGILVMVSGVVGSDNHRKLDPNEFRGFALADTLAPLVFVNGADTKAAQMFTLAHEIAHIWLGETALSNVEMTSVPIDEVERWCNEVAAELLVPLEVITREYNKHAALASEMARLARSFKVSTLVILRRLFDAGKISRDIYWATYRSELARLGDVVREGGGDFYLTLGSRVSKRFARAVVVSSLEGRSPFTEAFRLLGFKKMSTFDELGRTLGVIV
jgi:Zn-dependent peptidase ImmA (M78 family)